MAGQGLDLAELRPELGRGLHQCAIRLDLGHRARDSRAPHRVLPIYRSYKVGPTTMMKIDTRISRIVKAPTAPTWRLRSRYSWLNATSPAPDAAISRSASSASLRSRGAKKAPARPRITRVERSGTL